MSAEIGAPAPDFELPDQSGGRVALSSLRGRRTAVVFIPFPFTGTCEGELCAIRDNLSRFNDLDANVVVITCDTRPANAKWAAEQGFEFPILSDFWPHGETAIAYGCFNDKVGAANRATYILDSEGIVRDVIATDSLGTPRSIDDYWTSLEAV